MKAFDNNNATRRTFLKTSAALLGAFPIGSGVVTSISGTDAISSNSQEGVKLKWLIKPNSVYRGGTCGVVWPQGKVTKKTAFEAVDENGNTIALQSWPLAYWPDGSVKWTGHAVVSSSTDTFYIKPVKKAKDTFGIIVTESHKQILVDTGVLECVIEKTGDVIVSSMSRSDKKISKNGRLVLIVQDQPDGEEAGKIVKTTMTGMIHECLIEHTGRLRAVIKITGSHRSSHNETLIPFTLRLYFYHQHEGIRIIHSLVYDGDENKHFIKGIGISFDVPLTEKLYNRHIRFANSKDDGIFAEAVQGLTGLRRDPGETVRKSQREGKGISENDIREGVAELIKYIPAFGDYTLFQGSDQSFSIRKRTTSGFGWITSAVGQRAAGLMYLGTPGGGVAFGIKNFWQSYPSQLDIRGGASDMATVTAWLWAPDAPAMDMRFYHDGMGQDTFQKQREGLDITYEDYEPGFGTAKGVARTSELMLWVVDRTPDNKTLLEMTAALQQPPQLMCDLTYLASQKVFGGNWSLVDRSSAEKTRIEDQLDRYFDYYKKQVDYHHWYGFWNYGDFMHTYDADRHTWRYDVGGFAWDNSELSTDLWLWYYFLHTGRPDVFQVAEAMTRHTGEVDVHHLGRFAPLGSRHNVQHWGCSAKQLRISTAANRRMYYYLTCDERVGDLMEEQVNAVEKLKEIIPGRKLPDGGVPASTHTTNMASVTFGTDWGAVSAAWLTHWERKEDAVAKQKLINSMQTIGAQPRGFFTGAGWLDVTNGKFTLAENNFINVSHLNAVFGLTEICEELVALVDVPSFTKAWVDYCRLYNASAEEQKQALGSDPGKLGLQQGHARLTAFAASYLKDEALAKRAWTEFYRGRFGLSSEKGSPRTITGPEVLSPVEEDQSVSTNAVAQWGLAALQCLAYVGDHIQEVK